MASPFETAAAAAETAIDAVFGQAFSFTPMAVPVNGAAGPDGTRASVASFSALFADAGAQLLPGAQPTTAAGFGRVTVARTIAEAQIVVPKDKVPVLRAGDRVTRILTGVTYEIRSPQPAGHARWYALLQVVA